MIINHRLFDARQVPSPNWNERPAGFSPELVVIHCISLPPGQYANSAICDFFCNQLDASAHPYFTTIASLTVSAHLLIQRDGAVIQFVPFDKRAWHAGVSNYQGRSNCNDFSIGIELEGTDDSPFTAQQYDVLATTLRSLFAYYPALSPSRLTGHSDIAPGRKTDPGIGFSWERLLALL